MKHKLPSNWRQSKSELMEIEAGRSYDSGEYTDELWTCLDQKPDLPDGGYVIFYDKSLWVLGGTYEEEQVWVDYRNYVHEVMVPDFGQDPVAKNCYQQELLDFYYDNQ